jgi:hypothetical protein
MKSLGVSGVFLVKFHSFPGDCACKLSMCRRTSTLPDESQHQLLLTPCKFLELFPFRLIEQVMILAADCNNSRIIHLGILTAVAEDFKILKNHVS